MLAAILGARRSTTGWMLFAGALAALSVATSPVASHATVRGAPPTSPTPAIKIPKSLVKLFGQRIMVTMAGTTPDATLLNGVRLGNAGGVIIYGSNIVSDSQLTAAIVSLQYAAKEGGNPPLLIAIDQEGGGVKRLPGPPSLSPSQMVGTGKVSVAKQQGIATGKYLRGFGINFNIAPIVDVPTSTSSFLYRENRTFSFNANSVARYGTAFALGQQSQRVASAAGLFPGLGSATVDTDFEPDQKLYPTTAQRAAALKPYEMLIPQGVDAIMVGNAVFPAYDPKGRIADLSGPVIRGLLRDKLKFQGVVITDAIVRTGMNPVTSGVLAAQAGADIILCNNYAVEILRALESAYRSGRLSRADAVSSYERIVALKNRIMGGQSDTSDGRLMGQ
jgi:beta-N-acetylhexosaminidase